VEEKSLMDDQTPDYMLEDHYGLDYDDALDVLGTDKQKEEEKVQKGDCGLCANCTWRARWEASYAKALEDTPSLRVFVERQRHIDKTCLPCFGSLYVSQVFAC
jgi:hypothetical protein